jgi:ABC-2 type transport system permease protein
VRRLIDFYLTDMRIAIQGEFQYPAQNYFYIIGMIAEPVIYMVVWTSVAASKGGAIGGFTTGAISAYYIIWILVRNMNLGLSPYDWEHRIQHGRLGTELIRPIHPIHNDIAYFAGWKVVMIILWLPLAAILVLICKPALHPTWVQVVVFFFAIWGAYLVRAVALSLLGMISFWTTRVGALYSLYFALELIFSGRLVPMTFMPVWVQHLANYFPFQWSFYYPINALVGTPTLFQLLTGLLCQAAWIIGGILLIKVVWHFGIKRFSSVGN